MDGVAHGTGGVMREKHLDFDLEFRESGTGFVAEVRSPVGEGRTEFDLPFAPLALENFILKVGRPRRQVRRAGSPELQVARDMGGQLFDAVFTGEVGARFAASVREAHHQQARLRIRLQLERAPALMDIPWEFLRDASLNRFLALSKETPIVRYIAVGERPRPLLVKPPLRLLALVSSPKDQSSLDVEQEWGNLRKALRDLEVRGAVIVERVRPTLEELRGALQRTGFHMFHFIGHGAFDERSQEGVLLFEDESRKAKPVRAEHLATLLHDHRTMQLVTLNSCEGARTSRSDPFAGTAQSLVQGGIPAVVAMQFEITDSAAITLARELYTAIATGHSIDAALGEARKAIFTDSNDLEWATPVLFLRSADGHLFDFAQAPLYVPSRATPKEVSPPVAPAVENPTRAVETPRPRANDGAERSSSRRWLVAGALALLMAAVAIPVLIGKTEPPRPTPTAAPPGPTPAPTSPRQQLVAQYQSCTARADTACAADALWQLGRSYDARGGSGRKKALACYREAALRQHHDAQFKLAKIYDHCDGVPEDIDAAQRWYRAAGEGVPEAAYWYGRILGASDAVRGRESIQSAADRNFGLAEVFLLQNPPGRPLPVRDKGPVSCGEPDRIPRPDQPVTCVD
jgi:hypothetical protein